MLIGDLLKNSAKKTPNKIAIIEGNNFATFRELNQAANQIANAVIQKTIKKENNIGILSANYFEYPAIYFGLAKSGHILAHLSTRFSSTELTHVINDTNITLIFIHTSFLSQVKGLLQNLPKLKDIIVFGGDNFGNIDNINILSLEQFKKSSSAMEPVVEIRTQDPFAITFTGGTTGFPKGVVVSHESRVIASVRGEREYDISNHDINCCSTPFFHIAGLFVWFQTSIKMGCTSVLLAKWDPAEFIQLIENKSVTSAFLVPTQISSVLTNPKFSRARVKNWRYCNYGGAPTSPAQLEIMLDKLPELVWEDQYGQSEAGNLTVRPKEFILSKAKSVGRPFQGLEMSIVDNHGNELNQGERGEVVTKGVHTMLGYYNDPKQTSDAFTKNGWLKTGDIGYFDEDGFLFLVDRSKDMIISGGENIYPTEIESVIYSHPAVLECAVFGIPDDEWGELPAAHVIRVANKSVSEQELIEYCLTKLARHKKPRLIKFVDSIPKTAIGKFQKNLIKTEYWID